MARFDDSDFDPQTYGSQGQGGLLGLFQGMLDPKPAVPGPASSPSGAPNYSPQTPFSPQQDLIGRLQQPAEYKQNGPSAVPNITPTQQAAIQAAVHASVDPAKLYQYVAIENSGWDNNAVSSNGSQGLTQINEPRWADIKSHLVRAGQGDVADRLVDRSDPYQNALAWSHEYRRNSEQARSVLGRNPTTAETYTYWQTPKYAPYILANPDKPLRAAMSEAPRANAKEIEAIISANPSVYAGGNMSSQAVIDNVDRVMSRGTKAYQRLGAGVGLIPPPWPTHADPVFPLKAPARVLRSRPEKP